MNSGAASKYPVMPVGQICRLPVEKIADNNSVLFLWVTVPLLHEAFCVLTEWGFEYKTAIFWRKIMSLGMGFWFRGQVEICLVGIRGEVRAFRSQRPNFVQTKAGRHSEKPEEIYRIIEEVGLEPRIELFARKKRFGWDAWGNEVESDIALTNGGELSKGLRDGI